MQVMYLNVSKDVISNSIYKPWEVREMIDVLYRNHQSFWCTSWIGMCSLLRLQKLKTQEKKHLCLHCASTKFPFPVSLPSQLLALTRRAKEKTENKGEYFCAAHIFQVLMHKAQEVIKGKMFMFVWTLKCRNAILARINFQSAKHRKCPRYVRASNIESHRSMLENQLELTKQTLHSFQY